MRLSLNDQPDFLKVEVIWPGALQVSLRIFLAAFLALILLFSASVIWIVVMYWNKLGGLFVPSFTGLLRWKETKVQKTPRVPSFFLVPPQIFLMAVLPEVKYRYCEVLFDQIGSYFGDWLPFELQIIAIAHIQGARFKRRSFPGAQGYRKKPSRPLLRGSSPSQRWLPQWKGGIKPSGVQKHAGASREKSSSHGSIRSVQLLAKRDANAPKVSVLVDTRRVSAGLLALHFLGGFVHSCARRAADSVSGGHRGCAGRRVGVVWATTLQRIFLRGHDRLFRMTLS